MQVSKWGNRLAVRLPTAVVDALNLKEGDQIFAVAVRNAIVGAGTTCYSITETLGAVSENFCLPHRTS